jgi:tetratricopeptide (TPR) repeat protein
MSRCVWNALLVAALTLFALGCDEPAASPGESASAWVDALRDAHQNADAAEQRGDLAAAAAALSPLASAPAPGAVAGTHARAARQDVYFRLASLAAVQGDHEAARAAADAGLALGRGDDVLTANLLIARGEAQEALGEREGASADYLAALRINEVLLDAVLAEEEPR